VVGCSDRKTFLSDTLPESNQACRCRLSGFGCIIIPFADLCVHLFEDKGLFPSTIKGYRSSITRTLAISGGTDFSNNEFLSLLIRHFDLESLDLDALFLLSAERVDSL
jgi:hypothetical protein